MILLKSVHKKFAHFLRSVQWLSDVRHCTKGGPRAIHRRQSIDNLPSPTCDHYPPEIIPSIDENHPLSTHLRQRISTCSPSDCTTLRRILDRTIALFAFYPHHPYVDACSPHGNALAVAYILPPWQSQKVRVMILCGSAARVEISNNEPNEAYVGSFPSCTLSLPIHCFDPAGVPLV